MCERGAGGGERAREKRGEAGAFDGWTAHQSKVFRSLAPGTTVRHQPVRQWAVDWRCAERLVGQRGTETVSLFPPSLRMFVWSDFLGG